MLPGLTLHTHTLPEAEAEKAWFEIGVPVFPWH
jgi:hypothetical protein